jgi:2-polyprenyl-6-methoxyphenol hydroxylase-like FAD-dependent oxidoreductase
VTALRVAVVGGGIGGLCLAQGLRRDGVDVTVYERDDTIDSRRQGYRIHLDGRAGRALHECLPPELYELFTATLGRPGSALSVVDERLKVLHRTAGMARDPRRVEPTAISAPASRQTLRQILATGLDDALVFGRSCTGFAESPEGVRLDFADGTHAEADVLVGADGVGSAVRRQFLPQATVVDTGARCLYGKTLLTKETLALVPPMLFEGFTAVIGGRAVGMASGLVRFPEPVEQAAARICPRAHVTPVADYLMWAVTAPGPRFGLPEPELLALPPVGLHRLAAEAIAGWHPDLRALVDRAEVEETFLVRVNTSEPTPAWPSGRVTVLGDAIHAMSPSGGSGANTALTDARVLRAALVAAVRGETPLTQAIRGYEEQMRDYGYAAVAAAGQNMGNLWAQRHPVLARIVKLLGKAR